MVSRRDYAGEAVQAARSVMLELTRLLGEYRQSIVVVGGSNHLNKPGGKLIRNLVDHGFAGDLLVVNPKDHVVQGIPSFPSVRDLPDVDLAILAIPASICLESIELLVREKNTRAFIVISAGFSEVSPEGKRIENEMAAIVNSGEGTLIGPNCIGIMNPYHTSVFTTPVPRLWPKGCDFISGSGATAVFIMEAGIPKGLRFSSIWSVGNGAQTTVEDILEYLDEEFDSETSSLVKLLYLESIQDPDKLLHHSTSLIRKGCRIAAINGQRIKPHSRAKIRLSPIRIRISPTYIGLRVSR